jgi:hypothetical protein
MRAIAMLLCGLLSGCLFANASSSKRLGDTVNLMNRNTRWGQLADAARLVDPSYRPQFIASHHGWGQTLQVADSEVVHVEMAQDAESALAIVNYQWYLPDSLNVHETVIRQRWTRLSGNYFLLSEAVIQGDGRLLGKAGAAPKVMTADDSTTLGLIE